MTTRFHLTCLFLLTGFFAWSQGIVLKKGMVVDDLVVNDSTAETISLYLPSNYENSGKWPVLFVVDHKARGKQGVAVFRESAEAEGYILAASNAIHDSLSINDNLLIANRMINFVDNLFPIQNSRFYLAGHGIGGKMAATFSTVIPKVNGLVLMGASIPDLEILYKKKNFQFIGIVGNRDFNLLPMKNSLKLLNHNKYPNQLLVYDGEHQWPPQEYLLWSLRYFTLRAMAKGNAVSNSAMIEQWLKEEVAEIKALRNASRHVRAYDRLSQAISLYRLHREVDSLERAKREFRKDKAYRNHRRTVNAVQFRETLIREDYAYYLEEDVLTANYNNLGWWNYQMSQLKEYQASKVKEEQHMAARLKGYLNALIADYIDVIYDQEVVDREALLFAWMLKTITAPKDYRYYLEIISESARVEDFGTALFYLEELLKNGYTDKNSLYELPHSALLRITTEFNKIIAKYFEDPRYDPGEQ